MLMKRPGKLTVKYLVICILLCVFLRGFFVYNQYSGGHRIDIEPGGLSKRSHRTVPCAGSKRVVGKRSGGIWNVSEVVPPRFLPNFKNPCFLKNVTLPDFPPLRTIKKLRCLPYFFIVGFPKSGTTDVWFRLVNHPDIAGNHEKEPNFFRKGMLVNNFEDALEGYARNFERTTLRIHRMVSPALCHGTFPYHYAITGEASVDAAFDNTRWKEYPGNENCMEPRITNADYLHKLFPKLKVVFVVRNPVDRLYSDYIYEARFLQYNISRRDFHETVLEVIQRHKECSSKYSVRACAYNHSIDPFKVRLRVGMYHIFIKDWMDVFPRNQILVIKTEDMEETKLKKIYEQLFHFLEIRQFTKEEEDTVLNKVHKVNSRSTIEKQLGDMWNKTRTVLENFYRSHNRQLAHLLGDGRFLWNQ